MARHFLQRRAGRKLSPWMLKQVQHDENGKAGNDYFRTFHRNLISSIEYFSYLSFGSMHGKASSDTIE